MYDGKLNPVDAARPAREMTAGDAPGDRESRLVADFRMGGWLVEPMLNLLTRDGASVYLRAQLMDLLICLASRPGKVFSKEEILTDVWGGRWVADSALSRCIAELRAALGDDAAQPRIIQTIVKRGYRLIPPIERPAVAASSGSTTTGLRSLFVPRFSLHSGAPGNEPGRAIVPTV